jgi:phospholipid/cholesterol/gamma-HCH transport system permease protein
MSGAAIQLNGVRDGVATVSLSGDWTEDGGVPDAVALWSGGSGDPPKRVAFRDAGIGRWSSPLIAFLLRCDEHCRSRGTEVDLTGIPEGARHLLELATAVPEKKDAHRGDPRKSTLYCLGQDTIRFFSAAVDILRFIGESTLAFRRLLAGKAKFRWSDTFLVIQECGAEALPIVGLISLLTGMILGFVGSINLQAFGASILVADLVAIGVVREMGCIMTAVIMTGRTGAAFAAQLGTMKVNEEIDSFRTFGFSPIEFLVLPRMIALMLMMPLLCVFANVFGMVGGLAVSVSILDVSLVEYINQSINSITVVDFATGVVKGSFFGMLIALTGCLRGIQCGDSAASVGEAATSAVVTGITSIVVADAMFAIVFHILGI